MAWAFLVYILGMVALVIWTAFRDVKVTNDLGADVSLIGCEPSRQDGADFTIKAGQALSLGQKHNEVCALYEGNTFKGCLQLSALPGKVNRLSKAERLKASAGDQDRQAVVKACKDHYDSSD